MTPEPAEEKPGRSLFDPALARLNMEAPDKREAIAVLADALRAAGKVRETFLEAVLQREAEFPTGLPIPGAAIAIPHTARLHAGYPDSLSALHHEPRRPRGVVEPTLLRFPDTTTGTKTPRIHDHRTSLPPAAGRGRRLEHPHKSSQRALTQSLESQFLTFVLDMNKSYVYCVASRECGREEGNGVRMGWIGYLILALAIMWALQIVGTYFQMRHYREVLGGVTREETGGYVGVGNAKARFGKGVILILVVDENDVIKRALRMRGMTIFARFEEAPHFVGMSLDELRVEDREGLYDKGTMLAARRATEQIDRIKQEKERATA
jgi:glucitol operon activator protein